MAITDNLISYWELEEASGTRADAVVATGNDLTDNNTVTQAVGKVGSAAQFTVANSESLSRVSNSSLQTGNIDYTFCAWVYLDSKTAARCILAKNDTTNAEHILQYRSDSDRFRFLVFDGTGNAVADVLANTFGSPSLATWYFIAAWFDSVGGTASISVNDGTIDSAAKTGTPGTNAVAFCLGAAVSATFFDGRIDQVGFWKRVLTGTERTYMYNSGAGRAYSELTAPAGTPSRARTIFVMP